jgi:hypothetical protein
MEQVTRVLPEDGAVCAETCWRHMINYIYIYIYSTVCVHLVAMLKIKFTYTKFMRFMQDNKLIQFLCWYVCVCVCVCENNASQEFFLVSVMLNYVFATENQVTIVIYDTDNLRHLILKLFILNIYFKQGSNVYSQSVASRYSTMRALHDEEFTTYK